MPEAKPPFWSGCDRGERQWRRWKRALAARDVVRWCILTWMLYMLLLGRL